MVSGTLEPVKNYNSRRLQYAGDSRENMDDTSDEESSTPAEPTVDAPRQPPNTNNRAPPRRARRQSNEFPPRVARRSSEVPTNTDPSPGYLPPWKLESETPIPDHSRIQIPPPANDILHDGRYPVVRPAPPPPRPDKQQLRPEDAGQPNGSYTSAPPRPSSRSNADSVAGAEQFYTTANGGGGGASGSGNGSNNGQYVPAEPRGNPGIDPADYASLRRANRQTMGMGRT